MKPNIRRTSKLARWSYAKSLFFTILCTLLLVENHISMSFIYSCLTEDNTSIPPYENISFLLFDAFLLTFLLKLKSLIINVIGRFLQILGES